MALVGPGAMTEYTGGPRQGRRRGYCTVNEPADGFFIAGSSIDEINGIFGRVRTDSVWSSHEIGLAYRHDWTGWLMLLVEKVCSDSSEDDHEARDTKWEWVLVDTQARDRFMHDGESIIPGAGTCWKHLHRCTRRHKKDGETCTEPQPSETAVTEQAPDDEDELPWQVIAILDRSTMRDLRYTYRHYQKNIEIAQSGSALPSSSLPGLEDDPSKCGADCWLFRVVATKGVEVRCGPGTGWPVINVFNNGDYLRGIERRGLWLRLFCSDATSPENMASDNDDGEWVLMEDSSGTPHLRKLEEGDIPNLHSDIPDSAQADVFDRPFEPRLEGPESAEHEEAEESGGEDLEHAQFAADLVVVPSPPDELPLGARVMLEGLCSAERNGQYAKVVTKMTESGRQGVMLEATGSKISVKTSSLRICLPGEDGPCARHARVLGLSLVALGFQEGDRGGVVRAKDESATLLSKQNVGELLSAALRATQRDLEQFGIMAQSAREDAQAAYEILAHQVESAYSEATESAPSKTSVELPKAPHEVVECGGLGERAAVAARRAGSDESISEILDGINQLRQLMADEESRQQRILTSIKGRAPPCGSDLLRLRLTLVRALLRCRRDDEALRESEVATQTHPNAGAATFWNSRCLLRTGLREKGLQKLELAASGGSSFDNDSAWAAAEARARLKAIRKTEQARRRADDAYARGLFTEASAAYSDAIRESAAIIGCDDKPLHAELYANRAACYRRAREFPAALEDLDAALSLFPRYKRAILRKAVCLLEAGRPGEAIACFERLLSLDREWPNILEWLVRANAVQRRLKSGHGIGRDYFSSAPTSMGTIFDNGKWATAPDANDIASLKDHYAVLGVSTDATDKQLKRAYRVMSLKFHPDKEGGSTPAFQRVSQAYETLSDPDKRRNYDEGGDLKKSADDNDSSDDEREQQSLREEVERKYFPERYKFWPFGDPFIQKRKRDERRRRREGKPSWNDDV